MVWGQMGRHNVYGGTFKAIFRAIKKKTGGQFEIKHGHHLCLISVSSINLLVLKTWVLPSQSRL